jgi:hypothetical protein
VEEIVHFYNPVIHNYALKYVYIIEDVGRDKGDGRGECVGSVSVTSQKVITLSSCDASRNGIIVAHSSNASGTLKKDSPRNF